MHSHIRFHHVSPCPAVSPRRWAGHHPVRHPVRGSQTASEWLIINPGSLRPPNKNLNRSPPKKTAIKTEWSLWTVRQVHHQTQLEPTFGPFGIQKKRPQHVFAETGSPSGVAFASALTFWTGSCSPWKMLGIVMTHDLGDPIIWPASTKRQHRVLNTARVILYHFVGPFLGGKSVFQDSIPMLGSHSSFFGSSSQPSIT